MNENKEKEEEKYQSLETNANFHSLFHLLHYGTLIFDNFHQSEQFRKFDHLVHSTDFGKPYDLVHI